MIPTPKRVIVLETIGKHGEKVEKYRGWLHNIMQDHVEYEAGPGPYPAAIVENSQGNLEVEYVGNIQFERPTGMESPLGVSRLDINGLGLTREEWETHVNRAWADLRVHNNTIPSEALERIRNVAIAIGRAPHYSQPLTPSAAIEALQEVGELQK